MVLPRGLNHVSTQYHAEKHPIGYTPCTYHEGGFPRPVVSCRVQSILVFFSSQNRVRCWQCTVNPNLRSKTSGVLMKWLCPSRHLKYKIMPDGAKVEPKFKPKSGEACPLKSFYMVKKPLAFSKRKEIPGYLRATFWVSWEKRTRMGVLKNVMPAKGEY